MNPRVALLLVIGVIVVASVSTWFDRIGTPEVETNAVSPPLATGSTIADSANAAAGPRKGEVVYTPDPDDTTKYLMDRFNDLVKAHPNWQFPQPKFTHDVNGAESSITLRFADGSALRVGESPNRKGVGLVVDSVVITR